MVQRTILHFFSRSDESNVALARAENKLRGVLEDYLDDLVAQSEQYGLVGSLPLFNVDFPVLVILARRNCVGWRLEFHAVKIGLEVLNEDDLFLEVRRIVSKCMVGAESIHWFSKG